MDVFSEQSCFLFQAYHCSKDKATHGNREECRNKTKIEKNAEIRQNEKLIPSELPHVLDSLSIEPLPHRYTTLRWIVLLIEKNEIIIVDQFFFFQERLLSGNFSY